MFSANLAVYANAYMDPPGMRNPMTDDIPFPLAVDTVAASSYRMALLISPDIAY